MEVRGFEPLTPRIPLICTSFIEVPASLEKPQSKVLKFIEVRACPLSVETSAVTSAVKTNSISPVRSFSARPS